MDNKKSPSPKTPAKKAATKKASATAPALEDFLREVESKAYELFLERTRTSATGDSLTDWLQAEELVKKAHNL
ncbi:MAG: hypothetical protein HKM05_09310 [Spirochaetales bacterium]|nr:hypothetical protein [Spirochaetales bacterium]